jgi:hypothetical protein
VEGPTYLNLPEHVQYPWLKPSLFWPGRLSWSYLGRLARFLNQVIPLSEPTALSNGHTATCFPSARRHFLNSFRDSRIAGCFGVAARNLCCVLRFKVRSCPSYVTSFRSHSDSKRHSKRVDQHVNQMIYMPTSGYLLKRQPPIYRPMCYGSSFQHAQRRLEVILPVISDHLSQVQTMRR